MNPEELRAEKIRRRRLARFRFKSLVLKVRVNLHWIGELEKLRTADQAKKNARIIYRRTGQLANLTHSEKAILNIPIEERTVEQIQLIENVFSKLLCLDRFKSVERKKLASCAYYTFFEPGRTIVREGHHSSAVYFVLNGELTVSKMVWNLAANCHLDTIICAIGPGDSFGEVAVMDGTKRLATVTTDFEIWNSAKLVTICFQPVVSCWYKEDFRTILLPTLKAQWDGIKRGMQRFDCFQDFSESQITECCILARIKQFNAHEPICADDKGATNYVHFVLSGQCMILQYLQIVVDNNKKGQQKFQLFSFRKRDEESLQKAEEEQRKQKVRFQEIVRRVKGDASKAAFFSVANTIGKPAIDTDHQPEELLVAPPAHTLHRFVNLGTYSAGSFFGLGETMEHRTIVALDTVQCLIVPRYWLAQKEQNIGNIWERNKIFLDRTIPSREKVFKQYLQTQKWIHYKRQVINSLLLERKNKNSTTIFDVPVICRAEDKL